MSQIFINLIWIAGIIIAVSMIWAYIMFVIKRSKETLKGDKKEDINNEPENIKEESTANSKPFSYPYHKKDLLTKNEWAFYKELKPITDKYNLHILSKVRLVDLVEVNNELNNSERTTAFNKIVSKHVDFVLADPSNLRIKCVIELDDSSHKKIDRQQRDYFLDKLCETVKLPLIRCTDINGVEEQICEKLQIHKK